MREVIAIFLALLVTIVPSAQALAAQERNTQGPLETLLAKSHIELFETASDVVISPALIEIERKRIEGERKQEERNYKQQQREIERSIDQAQDQLKTLNQRSEESPEVAEQRHALHCKIQSLRKELQETKLVLEKGLDIRYDNKLAKLRILEQWPTEYKEIQQMLADGTAAQRKFGDFRDIGFRPGPWEGQEKDIKIGREAEQEMRRYNLLPPEIEDQELVDYVTDLANRIARHSDLKIPLKVHILKSKEINAFALPGGFLFINTGLILEASKESQLAGVMAHEIAHVTARHGHRLMTRANIASIIFQAAQLAALIFTGGISSIGAYYALQYGFMGLGLVMNLTLLGVSREYEIEADILGTQYLWDAGYNPKGFISFFSQMAEKEGYIIGLSWFRTHPPFYQRMAATFREYSFLPTLEDPVDDGEEFHAVKARLKSIMEEMEKRDRDAPTLKRVYDCESDK